MDCITCVFLLCSLGRALLSLEGTDTLLSVVRLPSLRWGSFSWVMTHQAPALAQLTVPVHPAFARGCD